MTIFIDAAFPVGFFLVCLGIGIAVGVLLEWTSERAHERAIESIESQTLDFSDIKLPPYYVGSTTLPPEDADS